MRTIKLMILVAALVLSACEKNDPKPELVKRPGISNEVKMPVTISNTIVTP